jgi:hypothetical protein
MMPFRARAGRSSDWFQIVLVFSAIECALWTQGRTQVVWSLVALVLLLICVAVRKPRVQDLGLGLHGMAGASWAIAIAALFCAGCMLLAWRMGTLKLLYGSQPVSWHVIFYAIWALEQQFILNAFFYRRFENLYGAGPASLFLTAGLFSLAHIPNPVLAPATFVGAVFFIEVFRRWRNLYPLAIAHAMFGLTLAVTIPDRWLRHMRVGIGFFRFHLRV